MTYSRVIGALFLVGFLFYGVGAALVTSATGAPDFLATISAHQTTLVIGAFLMLLNTVVDVGIAVQIIIAAVLGGRRTILGAALGAVFLILANEFLRPLGQLNTFVVSAVALAVILFFPEGLLGYALHRGERE